MNAGLDSQRDGSPIEQWRTVSERGERERSSVAMLTRQLYSDDKWVRIAAADALGNIGDQKISDTLAPLLFDRDHDVRFATAVALGKLGGPAARVALENACRDSNHFVRMAAEEALSHLKSSLEP